MFLRAFTVAAAGVALAVPALLSAQTSAAQAAERAAFVTRLGVDTIAVERFTKTAEGLRAEVMLRVPETSLRVYDVRFARDGVPGRMIVTSYDPAAGVTGEPSNRQEMELPAESPIPFIDYLHWPFELMLREAVAAGRDTMTFPLATARRPLPFVVARAGAGRYTATHPTRGTMTVEVDAQGRLQALDASRTTRALRVTRQDDVDVAALARRFAAEGRPMGELSGRGEVEVEVAGAEISVDYGVPLKRGREIFGALVPWEQVWRTGANRATHFATSRDLVVGDAVIPAGTYTLFTIPRRDGWTLMVNTRTNINGQSYDADADLVRLPMRVRTLDQVVEPFTVVVEDYEAGGVLRLQWDRTEAYLPFRVR
jgi:hypothetical protein